MDDGNRFREYNFGKNYRFFFTIYIRDFEKNYLTFYFMKPVKTNWVKITKKQNKLA